ncbi:unnamed protein product [Bursaphelenchus xylophilus]|uniref:(pine wood nematode) hypothetical protein n=1 Tax=Bursaphelenchus xylophilus TaxID=6326 RepID=A0A1I7RN06_BURXY|nr:unnamed protein product [Bursaphelenchus xylophilus]CAG9125292.1 unnamed protein product [Bursaphelenchus xylophilus]
MNVFAAFFAVVAVVAAGTISPADLAPQFRQGHEYSYIVEAQLASSLAGEEQNAVQRVRALMRCGMLSQKRAVCKLHDSQMTKLNDNIRLDGELVKFEQARKVKVNEEHMKVLQLPFEVNYENGRIVDLTFSQKDKTFSENIKRSVVNSLQLSLSQQEEQTQHFKVNETSIEGSCETLYTILPEDRCRSNKNQKSCVRIVKTINFENCDHSTELRYNFFRGEQLQDGLQEKESNQTGIQRSTNIEIELKRESEEVFVVSYAKSVAEYSVPLSLTKNQYLTAVAITEVRLQDIKQLEVSDEVETKKKPQSLVYNDEFDVKREKFYATGNEAYLKDQQYIKKSNIPEAVKNLLKAMAQTFVAESVSWEMDSRAPQIFMNLVKILRHASKDDIEEIHEKIYSSDAFEKKSVKFVKAVIVDALAAAGTHPTITHLLTKFRKDVSESKSASLLKRIAINIPFVSEEIVSSIWKVCDMNTEKKSLYKTCILSWSRLANAVCGQPEFNGDLWAQQKRQQPVCSEEFKNELNQNLKSLLAESAEPESRILALKAYGNLALELSVPQLEQIARDQTLDRIQRQVAIDAFRQFGKRMSKRISRILLPIFMDKNEYPEIRMEALKQLLNNNVDENVLQQISFGVMRDANMNIRAFTVSSVLSLAQKLEKRNPRLAQKLIAAETLIRQGLSFQQQQRLDRSLAKQDTELLGNSAFTFSSILSNDSYIPKDLQLSVDALINRHLLPIFAQYGIRQQNIEKVVDQLLQKLVDQPTDKILVRGRRSAMQKMVNSPVQTLKSIFDQLKIVVRRNENAPQFLAYKREQGMDVAFVYADQKHLPDFIAGLVTDGQIDISGLETDGEKAFSYTGAEMSFEQQLKVPTIFGIPLVYTAQAAHVYSIDGKTKLALKTAGNAINGAEFKINVVPKVSTQLVQKLEAISPLLTNGIQHQINLDAQMPLVVEDRYNENGLQIDAALPKQRDHTYKVVQISSHPSTLTREWPRESKTYVESEERTLHVRKCQPLFRETQKQWTSPFTGMRYEIRGHYHHPSEPDCLIVGENALQLHIHVEKGAAKKLRFHYKLETDSIQQTEGPKMLHKLLKGAHVDQLFKNTPQNEKSIVSKFAENYKTFAVTKVQSKLVGLALGADDQQLAKMEATTKTLCDSSFTLCSTDSEYRFKHEGSDGFKLRVVGEVARLQLHGVYGGVKSQHVLAHVETHWGKYNEEDKNTVSFCVYGHPSSQQVQGLAQQSSQYDDEDYPMTQMPTKIHANHYTILMENQLNGWTTQHIRPLVKFVQLYTNPTSMVMSAEWSAERALPRHSVLKNDIVVEDGHVRLITDDEHEVSARLSQRKPHRSGSSRRDIFTSQSANDMARCTLDNKHNIESFNGKTYRIPLTSCYTVLSADCSSEEPKYAILAKTGKNGRLTLQLLNPRGIYTIEREADETSVKVNGEAIAEDEYQRYGVSIVRRDQRVIYVLHCRTTGMEIRYDGENVSVFLPDEYVNQQCGVCGRFSNSQDDSLRLSNNQLAKTLKEFHASYLYRESGCDASEVEKRTEKHYRQEDSFESAESDEMENLTKPKSDESRVVKPQQVQQIREFREFICISQKALAKCPRGFEAQGLATEQKEFVCIRRHHAGVQALRQRVLDGEIIEDLKKHGKTVKLFDVELPKRCSQFEQF